MELDLPAANRNILEIGQHFEKLREELRQEEGLFFISYGLLCDTLVWILTKDFQLPCGSLVPSGPPRAGRTVMVRSAFLTPIKPCLLLGAGKGELTKQHQNQHQNAAPQWVYSTL
jgi:hypothetical protein